MHDEVNKFFFVTIKIVLFSGKPFFYYTPSLWNLQYYEALNKRKQKNLIHKQLMLY